MMLREFLQWYSSAPIGARAEAISSLARSYLYSDLDDETRGGMDAAMTLALDDSAHAVRFALADALASNPRAPRHVLIALAADHSDIASLVLQRSPIFVDAELVDVAAGGSEALQIAIASRPSLSMSVAAAIAEVGDQNACRRLLANPGARIARISLRRIAERLRRGC